MSFGFFVLGMIMMTVGFFAVWKTNYFLQWFGDISELFGVVNAQWLSWKAFGVFLMFFGFLIAFNLFGTIFAGTIGQFLLFGQTY